MFSRTWREALRKLQAGTAVHPAIVRHGVGGGQSTRQLHQIPGPGCCRPLQPAPRSLRDVGCAVPYSAGGLRCFQRAASTKKENSQGGLATQEEDPFDPLTDRIPEKPVSVAEGASYSIVILAGLAVAGAAAYAVFKELILQPKEYKIFGKALERVQKDNEVTVRLGSPITGYGQESRNRAARQRIANRTWTDEDGVERCEVVFYIRGPQGAGKVHSEMYKDKADRTWKFTYLIVDVTNPYPTRLMLESYIPSLPAATAA